MIIKDIRPIFSDERGQITDIIHDKPVDSITILTSKKGAVRGNHFHKETTQYLYILEGSCNYHSQVDDNDPTVCIAVKGDLIISPPLERHAIEALQDSVFLAFCRGPRSGSQYETDTYRLEVPLCRPMHQDVP